MNLKRKDVIIYMNILKHIDKFQHMYFSHNLEQLMKLLMQTCKYSIEVQSHILQKGETFKILFEGRIHILSYLVGLWLNVSSDLGLMAHMSTYTSTWEVRAEVSLRMEWEYSEFWVHSKPIFLLNKKKENSHFCSY